MIAWAGPADTDAVAPAPVAPPDPWPVIHAQAGIRARLLAEQFQPVLDALEKDETDPVTLAHLYAIDHASARLRQLGRCMSVLASEPPAQGGTTSLLVDVIREAQSAAQFYSRLTIDPPPEVLIVPHAASDAACLLAVLIDNATRWATEARITTVATGHGATVYVTDNGPGLPGNWWASLNAAFTTPPAPVRADIAQQTGFSVAIRLIHRLGLKAHCAPGQNGIGTMIAMELPWRLLAPPDMNRPAPPFVPTSAAAPSPPTATPSGRHHRLADAAPGPFGATAAEFTPGGLPRRRVPAVPRGAGAGSAQQAASSADPAPFPDDFAAFAAGITATPHVKESS